MRHQPLLPSCAVDEWGFVDESASNSALQYNQKNSNIFSKRSLLFKEYKPLLNALGEYTRTLSNFFQQSINTIIINPVLGRGINLETNKGKIREIAIQQGLKPDVIPIAAINLADAVKVLPKLQKEFRQLIAKLLSSNEIDSLEHQENSVYSRVWSLWYFFTFHPEQVLHDASEKCTRQLTNTIRRVRNNLRQKLEATSSGSIHINIASEDILWEQERALWLTIDGKNAVEVYNSVESVITTIRQAVCEVENTELRRYALDFNWPFVVIVPLVRGKSLTAMAWHISLPVLLSGNEQGQLKWWNFVQHPIPLDALTELGFTTWTVPRLEVANRLIASVSQLSLLASHIRDFERLPELDEQGLEQFQNYIQSLSDPMSEAFQPVLYAETEIANFLIKLSPSQYEERPNLVAVREAIKKLHEHILPSSDFQDSLTIDFRRIVEWANRLERGKQYAFLTYLFWASDVLDEVEV